MKYIKEFDYITIYKTDLVTGSLHFSGVCPQTNIVYDFILTGHTPFISPIEDDVKSNNRTELDNNIMLDGIKERKYCIYLLLKSHINSPFSSSTASIKMFYLTKPDGSLPFEMVMIGDKKYLVEIKNREYTYSKLKKWGTAIIEQVKWNRLKPLKDYELIYIHTTTDGYLLNFKLNGYINNDSSLNFQKGLFPQYNKNKNRTEMVPKMVGYIPVNKAYIRKFN